MSEGTMKVGEAARLLGVRPQCVRLGLQQKSFPWGVAVKTSSQWTYIIYRKKFEQETGITNEHSVN